MLIAIVIMFNVRMLARKICVYVCEESARMIIISHTHTHTNRNLRINRINKIVTLECGNDKKK